MRLMVLLLCMWRVQWVSCRTASAALRVAGGAGCVTTTRRLTISKTLQHNMCAGTLLNSIIAFRTRGTLHIQTRF